VVVTALVMAGLCIFFANLFWSGIQDFRTDGTADGAIWALIKVGGGGFCAFWTGLFTVGGLKSGWSGNKESRLKDEARGRDLRQRENAVKRATKELASIDQALDFARVMLDATRNSTPTRTIPFASAQ
jgi:hypothetical protein